jgi:putative transposase
MILSELGLKAEKLWHDIPRHFPFVELSDFVVMPNRVHGIIIINKPVETQNFASPQQTNDRPV